MKFILDERQYALDLLENGTIGKSEKISIRILLKYYRSLGLTKDQAIADLFDFMATSVSHFRKSDWEDLVNHYATSVYNSDKADLVCVKEVVITKSEWDTLLSVEDEKKQRVLYCLLVYKKVQNEMNHQYNEWFYGNLSEIFKMAKISGRYATVHAQCMTIYELKEAGYLSLAKSIKSLNLKLNYIEPTEGLTDESVAFVVRNFEDVLYEYYLERQIRTVRCEICHKAIKLKKNERTNRKYCRSCQQIAKNKRSIQSYHRQKFPKIEEALTGKSKK